MTLVITGIEDFSIENYRRVAAGESVELAADVLVSIDAVRQQMLTVLGGVAANHPVYGVNVGAGDGWSSPREWCNG